MKSGSDSNTDKRWGGQKVKGVKQRERKKERRHKIELK